MKTTLYLIRHAQIAPSPEIHFSKWPLSETGKQQAIQIADLLLTLKLRRCIRAPFIDASKQFVTLKKNQDLK